MDLNALIIYRGFTLNDPDVEPDPGTGIGDGIEGCVIDSFDISDVDVIQFMEKRSLQDGMDAGDVYLGARRIRLAGTLYGKTRALLYDSLASLRAALSPTLAFLEEPLDKGYQPMYFSVPTNRADDYPSGAIELRALALPRAFQAVLQRDQLGGHDGDALAIPWQATFVMRDPSIQGESPQDYAIADSTLVTGATAAASTNLITKASHGLVAGDRVYFTTLTGGTGLDLNTAYYVISSGLTTGVFKVSTTSGGGEKDITVDYSTVVFVKLITQTWTVAGENPLVNRGNYHTPLNMLIAVGTGAGSIVVSVAGSNFTLTVPSSTNARILRFKGADKIVTLEEEDLEETRLDIITFQNETTWPMIPEGDTELSLTATGLVIDVGATDGSHFWFWETYA